jgi:hypothetical protein
MKTNIKLLGTAFVVSAALFASQEAGATTSAVTISASSPSPYTQQGTLPQVSTGSELAQWGPSAIGVWASDNASGDMISNNRADTAQWLASSPINATGTLTSVDSTLGASADDTLSSVNPLSRTFGTAVQWIALHYDNKEVAFQFAGITKFDFKFLGTVSNLSSIRAYTTSAVPLPAAVWLVGSALLSLVGLGRKKAALPRGLAA